MTDIQNQHRQFLEYSVVFKGNTPNTIRGFKGNFGVFKQDVETGSLEGLNRPIIEQWIIQGKLDRKWSAKTIRNKLQWMSLFIDWGIGRGLGQKNFVKDIPRPKLPKQLPKSLSKADAQRLLDWAQHFPYQYKFDRARGYAIIATFLLTGIRKGELYSLKMNDIDFEAHSMLIECGKGQKDRLLPMNSKLEEALLEYLKERNRMKKENIYFFSAMRQDSQMGDKVVKRLFEKIREKCKMHIYPHMLRHTFATLMLEGGCDIYSLSKMMGHTDIKTTTIYLSATVTHLQEQIVKHPLNF